MIDEFEMVAAFQEKFRIPINNVAQINHIVEETDELANALLDGDKVAILDSICDLLYLTLGVAYQQGFTGHTLLWAFEEVHASNMSKTASISAATHYVTKGTGYIKPNLAAVIARRKP